MPKDCDNPYGMPKDCDNVTKDCDNGIYCHNIPKDCDNCYGMPKDCDNVMIIFRLKIVTICIWLSQSLG